MMNHHPPCPSQKENLRSAGTFSSHRANCSSMVMFTSWTLIVCLVATATPHATALRYLGTASSYQKEVFESWANATGRKVETTFKPLRELMPEVTLDLKQNSNLFDVYQVHPVMTSLASRGWIREVTNDVKDPKFKWADIALSVRKYQSEYNGGAWSIPVDTDSYMLYYRRDLISSPPTTWEEYIEVAKKFHGQDLNGDGIPDFGACTITTTQFHKLAYTIASTVMKFKKGSRQGFMFDVSDRDDELMTNLLETKGWTYTMELLKEIWKYGQGEEVVVPKAFAHFRSGRCATYISFGSAGGQTVRPGSYIFGKLGVARAPGATKVYDRTTDSLVPCNDDLCGYMEPGKLNRPTYSTGGVQLVINPNLQGKDLEDALDFCAYFTRTVDVRKAGSLNPFRDSHFNATWFTEADIPWERVDAEQYTSALRQAIDFSHTTAHPPLPTGPILDTNIDRAIYEYVRLGKYNATTDDLPTIMANCVKRINEESLADGFTPELLEAAMRQAYALPVYAPPQEEKKEFPYWIISIIVVVVAAIVIGLIVALQKVFKTANAPKDPKAPFAALFIGPKNISELWQRHPDTVPDAQAICKDRVRKAIKANKCYEARRIGDYFLIVSSDPARLVNAAATITKALSEVAWNDVFVLPPEDVRGSTVLSSKKKTTVAGRRQKKAAGRGGGADRQSLRSEASSKRSGGGSSAWSDAATVKFAAGFAFGTGHISYDEETNHYDYSGAVVEDAAHVADIAQPNQLLATETVVNVVEENDSSVSGAFAAFCQKKLKGCNKAVDLQQFNVSGMAPKTFAVPSDDGEVVDSVMSALEQAAGGLSQKRVTILNVRVLDFASPVSSSSTRDALTRKYNEMYEIVADEVAANRGHIDQFQGGDFIISFNAVHPTAGHAFRAGICAMGIITGLREYGYSEVYCGFDTGVTWVGRMPSSSESQHHAVVGPIIDCARALARKCTEYPDDEKVCCLTTSRFRDDLSTALYFQYVDIARGSATAANGANKEAVGLLSVVARKQTDEDDCDEWIYELQNHDSTDPFAKINKCFEALLGGDAERAQEACDAMERAGTSGSPQHQKPLASSLVQRIKTIAAAGSAFDSYFELK